MRIAVIASLLPADTVGGAERYVAAVARSLAERHEVVILTGSERGRVDGLDVVRLPHLPHLARGASSFGKVVWHALDQWLPPVHRAVARELRHIAPDVVATHHPQGLSAAVFTGIAATGIPHVHTAHDLNILCARSSMTRNGEFCGGRCLDCRIQRTIRGNAAKLNLTRLIGVSRYICDRHVRAGIVAPEHARAIRLGAPPGTSRQRGDLDGGPTIGFIGALSPHKGIATLLRAFDRADPSWRLVIAGSGSCETAVVDAVATDPRIRYLGQVEGRAKDAFFDGLDVVVIPSEWEEPATFVAAEAAVRGIPAVVSQRGGLPETPEARTFRAGDPEELLRAVRWFADDPDHLERASRRLLARRTEFEWSTHVARAEAVLEESAAEA